MFVQVGFNGRFFPNNWRPAHDEIAFAREAGFAAIQFPGPEEGLKADEALIDSLKQFQQAIETANHDR